MGAREIMTKRLSLFSMFAYGFLIAGLTSGRMFPIGLDEFRDKARCVAVVEVVSTDEFAFISPPTTEWLQSRNQIAEARVKEWVASGPECSGTPRELNLLFATERHSSHPKTGETALVSLQQQDGYFIEAAYGRSYWRLKEMDGIVYVEVDWRNSFLINPFEIDTNDERSYLPLMVVRQIWAHTGESKDSFQSKTSSSDHECKMLAKAEPAPKRFNARKPGLGADCWGAAEQMAYGRCPS